MFTLTINNCSRPVQPTILNETLLGLRRRHVPRLRNFLDVFRIKTDRSKLQDVSPGIARLSSGSSRPRCPEDVPEPHSYRYTNTSLPLDSRLLALYFCVASTTMGISVMAFRQTMGCSPRWTPTHLQVDIVW
jgi:hypothetical protein